MKCKNMKASRNLQMTKKYLKENDLLAVPFEKGIGICIMKKSTYNNKMKTIIKLPQFEKMEKRRKNEKHPVLKGGRNNREYTESIERRRKDR